MLILTTHSEQKRLCLQGKMMVLISLVKQTEHFSSSSSKRFKTTDSSVDGKTCFMWRGLGTRKSFRISLVDVTSKGVLPSASSMVRSAPCSSKSWVTSYEEEIHALCSAVRFSLQLWKTKHFNFYRKKVGASKRITFSPEHCYRWFLLSDYSWYMV